MAVVQSEKPNFYWLLSVWWADSREAWRLAGLAPRQGRLVEEEEAVAEVEVSADSSGGILKEAGVVQVWVEGQGTRQQGFWLAWHGLHVPYAIPSHPHTSPDRG